MEYIVPELPSCMLAYLKNHPLLSSMFNNISEVRYASMGKCVLSLLYGRQKECPWVAIMQKAHKKVNMTPEIVAAWKECFDKAIIDLHIKDDLIPYIHLIHEFVDELLIMPKDNSLESIIERYRTQIPENMLKELAAHL